MTLWSSGGGIIIEFEAPFGIHPFKLHGSVASISMGREESHKPSVSVTRVGREKHELIGNA